MTANTQQKCPFDICDGSGYVTTDNGDEKCACLKAQEEERNGEMQFELERGN